MSSRKFPVVFRLVAFAPPAATQLVLQRRPRARRRVVKCVRCGKQHDLVGEHALRIQRVSCPRFINSWHAHIPCWSALAGRTDLIRHRDLIRRTDRPRHDVQPLAPMRRARRRRGDNRPPCRVAHASQVSKHLGKPQRQVAPHVFQHHRLRSTRRDDPGHMRPQVARVARTAAGAGCGKRLARIPATQCRSRAGRLCPTR